MMAESTPPALRSYIVRPHTCVLAPSWGTVVPFEDERMIFFHGIFLQREHRRHIGIDESRVQGATLMGFRKPREIRPSTVIPAPGGTVFGMIAPVGAAAMGILEKIESSPEWYRREAIRMEAGGKTVGECEVYLLNAHAPATGKQKKALHAQIEAKERGRNWHAVQDWCDAWEDGWSLPSEGEEPLR